MCFGQIMLWMYILLLLLLRCTPLRTTDSRILPSFCIIKSIIYNRQRSQPVQDSRIDFSLQSFDTVPPSYPLLFSFVIIQYMMLKCNNLLLFFLNLTLLILCCGCWYLKSIFSSSYIRFLKRRKCAYFNFLFIYIHI